MKDPDSSSPLEPLARDRARRLRREQTEAESRLWGYLRNRQLGGIKFRRQYPVGPFVADFISLERRLVIELDGGQHGEPQGAAGDRSRDVYLRALGYEVLHFWNPDVLSNPEGVLERIVESLDGPSPASRSGRRPLPIGRGTVGGR